MPKHTPEEREATRQREMADRVAKRQKKAAEAQPPPPPPPPAESAVAAILRRRKLAEQALNESESAAQGTITRGGVTKRE